MSRESWKLNIISDPEHPARLRSPRSEDKGNAFDFAALMQLASKHAVRFPKIMTCLNIGTPLGMGVWEGVPLRELVWLAQPRENLRRVFFYGYHNDDPKQLFQSSLPIGRVFEDPFDLPPVIVCYKLNGQFLTSQRGGPVRIVVPEAYGFKSIKWLNHLVLSNISHANDTYALQNNDIDSPLKTFAATLGMPEKVAPDSPFAITGYAQVGIAGLSKIQVWIQREGEELANKDRYFSSAPWVDAKILPAPKKWGGGIDKMPASTHGFDDAGRPTHWPLRLTRVHWGTLHPGLPAGEYTLRSRSIDEHGVAQPMPRPFRKSGHSAIGHVELTVG
jgi:DMSO/TMAO reductase YedYZ molybdopterin-dependent catalytic subunit